MTPLILPSPAKINLFLHINNRREDGYHELQTLFQFLDYSDTLRFEPTLDGRITLSCNLKALESDDNLIIRAARILQTQYSSQPKGIKIHLEKRLPMGGGVGGGSSNAATTLLALNRLWDLNLSQQQLMEIGLTLGADIPVFIKGEAVFAQGVGEVFTQANPVEHWYLVAKPNCHVSTAGIFQHPELHRDSAKLANEDYHFDHTRNDCEPLVKKLYPEVANTIDRLLEYAPTRLTGTGACVFSVYSNRQSAEKAMAYLPKGVSGFVCQGVNVSPTKTALGNI
ncbi:MAG: 4-(cytidine 5'-diphospho)-2-C-methyl-D-erythritol kinase [Algicola sp.]|nr:4-(cytidine 5'-diphospho)-2-C-methyl-D-erythritol kinase [Algicola sp.]